MADDTNHAVLLQGLRYSVVHPSEFSRSSSSLFPLCLLSTYATSLFHVGPKMTLKVHDQASPTALRNIHGYNWAAPPLMRDHVTYCYIDDAQSRLIHSLADKSGARCHNLAVRVDGERLARLIYHKNGADELLHGNVDCLLVLDDVMVGSYEGTRWLRLVHLPPPPPARRMSDIIIPPKQQPSLRSLDHTAAPAPVKKEEAECEVAAAGAAAAASKDDDSKDIQLSPEDVKSLSQ